MKNIGFIGLGNMGKGMSLNLAKSNYNIYGYDLNDEVFSKLKHVNISKCSDIKTVILNSEIIVTMLPDGKAVELVWKELIQNIKHKQILIDCSTIDVETSLVVQDQAKCIGIETLDAPVSGGVIGAENGTLTFMIGGKLETLEKVNHIFEIMGNKIIHCGFNGAGQSAKICNNLLLASTMIAVGESFKLGENLGLNLNKLFEVLSTSSGSCWAINTYCPIKNVGPNTPADKNYEGGFSANLMHKDLGLAIEAINKTNISVDFARKTYSKFEKLTRDNNGNLDFSNVINF